MAFTADKTKVRAFSAGTIKKTGFYPCTIVRAYDRKSLGTESVALQLDMVTDQGESASASLWYIGRDGTSLDKNGKELSALGQINDLMLLLEIEELKPKAGMVKIKTATQSRRKDWLYQAAMKQKLMQNLLLRLLRYWNCCEKLKTICLMMKRHLNCTNKLMNYWRDNVEDL